MLGIILLLLFLFSPVWAASCWAIKEKGSQTRRAGQGRAGRESVDALMMRLNQYKVDAGRWSGKKPKISLLGQFPILAYPAYFSYMYYICTGPHPQSYPPASLPSSLLPRCLPSLSHLNTYAYLIWHGFGFAFAFSPGLGLVVIRSRSRSR